MYKESFQIRSIIEQFCELLQQVPKFPFRMDRFTITAHAAICEELLELSTVYNYCCREFGVYEQVFEGIQLNGICIDFTLRCPIIIKDFYQLVDILIFFEDKMMVFNKKLIYDYQI
ncbi:hypothetical protein [Sporosarcina sp. FSL K6-5500]|uniref:hypothetical protein n=1 Tax=Sporosarcina sp. FSL K6-5500 TaxID=2921558 RepID=UPI0030FC243F